MSLKETLGLRTYREDPKLFWFEMTLLCLGLGLAGFFLSLAGFSGLSGLVFRVLRGIGLSWAMICAVLTEASGRRKKISSSHSQIQLENRLLLLSAALVLLEQLLSLFPSSGRAAYPVVFAGIAVYFIARIAGPRLSRKESFSTREILMILACGVLACVLLISFLDMAVEIVSAL
ncbi:MAG: hypothetical protein VB071_00585 [Lawsonibacter sp.]|nr:hypothetical protein [Lawsonibacter sp.]